MGVQYIFVVEPNKSCQSDWIYIKSSIEKFCMNLDSNIKLSVVYMDGKSKFQSKEIEINKRKKPYAAGKTTNESKAIFCFDLDNYDREKEDEIFVKKTREYCKNKNFYYVWFCKNIEEVYLKRRVSNVEKTKEARKFKAKKSISTIDKKDLLLVIRCYYKFPTLLPLADKTSLGTTRFFLSIYLPHLPQLIPSSYQTSVCDATLSLTIA